MEKILSYIKNNQEKYVEELTSFLRIPSISTSEENKNDMQTAAKFVADKLKIAGLKTVEIHQTAGHPIVYAEWMDAPDKPTVLFYGHYDVQPVDPVELWHSPPFEPVIKDDKIYARGATDDKGQLYIHIKSVEAWLSQVGKLPVNVKFLIEGEEEIGSPNLAPFIIANKNKLKCDSVLVSDTSLFAPGLPTITYGLRGLSYVEIEVTGPNRDLHSGAFGGAVPNPINVLAEIISKLHDKNGKINIDNFYADVIPLTKKERESFQKLKFSEKDFAKNLELTQLEGEKGYSTLERIWARPTLDCNGIWGGFTGKGAKTVIPSRAYAKISMRLVANQDPKKITKLIKNHILKLAPKSVKVKVSELHGGYPVITPLDHKATLAAAKAMEKAFGKKTVFIREGGSIPVIATFATQLKAPSVLMGLGLNTENLHSPNEHFHLKHFNLGILSSAIFLDEYSK